MATPLFSWAKVSSSSTFLAKEKPFLRFTRGIVTSCMGGSNAGGMVEMFSRFVPISIARITNFAREEARKCHVRHNQLTVHRQTGQRRRIPSTFLLSCRSYFTSDLNEKRKSISPPIANNLDCAWTISLLVAVWLNHTTICGNTIGATSGEGGARSRACRILWSLPKSAQECGRLSRFFEVL